MRTLRAAGREALDRFGFDSIDASAAVRELRLAERQLVEIIKTLIRQPKVLVLDEVDVALPPKHVEWLFKTVREFAAKGGIVIFISHRLAEIEALCDEVTVFREGTDVGRGKLSEMPEEQLVELMLGRKLERVFCRVPEVVPEAKRGVVCSISGFQAPPRLNRRASIWRSRKGRSSASAAWKGRGKRSCFCRCSASGGRRVLSR